MSNYAAVDLLPGSSYDPPNSSLPNKDSSPAKSPYLYDPPALQRSSRRPQLQKLQNKSINPGTAPVRHGPSKRAKRQKNHQTCESCKQLRVCCVLDPSLPIPKCKRCIQTNRECALIPESKMRRRMRTDTRMNKLERRFESLKCLLTQRGFPITEDAADEAEAVEFDIEEKTRSEISPFSTDARSAGPLAVSDSFCVNFVTRQEQQDVNSASFQLLSNQGTPTFKEQSISDRSPRAPIENLPPKSRCTCDTVNKHRKPRHSTLHLDVVDRRVISMDKATQLFDTYVNNLLPHHPIVVFPEGTTAQEIRQTKPILFLAVIAAAAATSDPDLNFSFSKELLQLYAERVMTNGTKSLELIQSILVTTVWYCPPDHFDELAFSQYIHAAATMALDMCLEQKTRNPSLGVHSPGCTEAIPPGSCSAASKTAASNCGGLESRRTLLACYLSCAR